MHQLACNQPHPGIDRGQLAGECKKQLANMKLRRSDKFNLYSRNFKPVIQCTECFIMSLAHHSDSKTAVWIGGTDELWESHWVWYGDDVPISGYSNWYSLLCLTVYGSRIVFARHQVERNYQTKNEFLRKQYEPRHDKTNKVSVRPARTQISLGIRPV